MWYAHSISPYMTFFLCSLRVFQSRKGGHAFPRRKARKRHTVLSIASYDEAKTKLVLRRCKEKGVSIGSVLFPLSGIAWSRMCARETEDRENISWKLPLYVLISVIPL